MKFGIVGVPVHTVMILFSGRGSSSLEALRLPSLSAPVLSTSDGMVAVFAYGCRKA